MKADVAYRCLAASMVICLVVGPRSGHCQQGSADPHTRSAELAAKYVGLFSRKAELSAQIDVARSQALYDQPTARHTASIPGFADLPVSVQSELASALDASAQEFVVEAERYAKLQASQSNAVRDQWSRLRAIRVNAEMRIAEIKATTEGAEKLAALFSIENRWFWLSGLLTLSVLVGISWHDRRHEYRRRLNGGKARSLGMATIIRYALIVVALFTVTTTLFGGQIYRWLTNVSESTTAELLAEYESEIGALENEVSMLQKERDAIGNVALAAPPRVVLVGGQSPFDSPGQWTTARDAVEAALVALTVQNMISAEAIPADAAKITQLSAGNAADVQRLAAARWWKRWIRVGIGASLAVFSIVATGLFLRGVKRRRKDIADTCPQCLARGKLEPTSDTQYGDNALRCTHEISQDPYEECNFVYPATYRHLPKLCFPTLGHPQAGKTHWLAMMYRELNQGNFQSHVQFDRVRSSGSDQFDQIVDEIINSRLDPGATDPQSIPHPVLFSFTDNDRILGVSRFAQSNLLVSIFDYSGEVLQRMTLSDYQRRRALDADGYLFFLDPTQPADDQVKELLDFRQDVREVHKVTSGQALQVPVALCVSKIDLMVNQSYADYGGSGPVADFYKELAEIDPGDGSLSLRMLQRRSELIHRMRDTIWPGWQIENQIGGLFGGRYMFFPLTPVGMNSLGESDLRSVTAIEPFGIIEPLLWLLHMNGYPVLDE